jgi:hypothetical protein
LADTPQLHLEWSDHEDNGTYVNDLVGSAEQVAGDCGEPRDTLALACASAITAEGLTQALNAEWSLYTPQDAAVVASALYSQVASSIANLRSLDAAVRRVEQRADVQVDHTVSDALQRLTMTADSLHAALAPLRPVVETLDRTPTSYVPAENVHETLEEVATLLGPGADLINNCGGQGPSSRYGGCGCVLHISQRGDVYYFDYGEAGWSLLCDGDAQRRPDGTMAWVNPEQLEVKEPEAHPAHLVAAIRRAIDERVDA